MWNRNSLRPLRRCRFPWQQPSARRSVVHVTRTCSSHHSNNNHDDDDESATALVERLMHHAQELMSSSRHHVVAYSGGVDSSLVAALLQQSSGENDDTVRAVFGISPAVSQEQVEQARRVAQHLQIPMTEIRTSEGSDEMYVENAGQACLACKTHLYSAMHAVSQHVSAEHTLYNGTNADDLKDSTRVGLIAAREFEVKSPLEYITKAEVRRAALHLGLPNWNAAAAPCLRSRLALGVEATQRHLNMIERAERHVRSRILQNMDPTMNLRVRMLTRQRAMIEVDEELLHELQLKEEDDVFFRELGFSSVSARPFRTGSVATAGADQDHSGSVAIAGVEQDDGETTSDAVAAVG